MHVGESLRKLRHSQHKLSQELGRAPSVEELAQATGLKPLDIHETLFRAQQPLSLDATLGGQDDSKLIDRLCCAAPVPDERLGSRLMRYDLRQLLQELPSQEAELLCLRYGINKTAPLNLSAAARSLGISRDTARGIERRAVAAVKDRSQRVVDYLQG